MQKIGTFAVVDPLGIDGPKHLQTNPGTAKASLTSVR